MITVIIFIIILGLLIFVHELGHFLVVRKNGVKAEEFGFGFPPRIIGIFKNERTGKFKIIGNRSVQTRNTVYSLNWIPLGGFVKIKGEDGGGEEEHDSFASRPALVRIKILTAGVLMNFFLAWVLLSVGLMIGAPQAVKEAEARAMDSKIQITQVVPGSPAEEMGIKIGDEVVGCRMDNQACDVPFATTTEVQKFINENRGNEITLEIKRGKQLVELKGTPRVEHPEEQGALGISLVHTALIKFPWYEAIVKGLLTVFDITVLIFVTLADILKGLIVGEAVTVDIAGPVGIAYLTKQVSELGLVYIIQFAALLSINLGIINGLPIPALDGGRIIFILIEKIKGSPVKRKTEQLAHTIGFVLLIGLMIVVTLRDVIRFDVVEKIGNIF